MNRVFSVRGFALGVCLVSVLAVLGSANRASAQIKQGKYITQASARLAELVDAGNKAGYSLHNNAFTLGGGWLKKSEEWVVSYPVEFTAGKKYRLVAAGDDDAKHLDLRILDSKGNQVAIDDEKTVDAVINYSPKVTGKYTVQMRLHDSRNDNACVCVCAVMRLVAK
jgi:hypothetical protein